MTYGCPLNSSSAKPIASADGVRQLHEAVRRGKHAIEITCSSRGAARHGRSRGLAPERSSIAAREGSVGSTSVSSCAPISASASWSSRLQRVVPRPESPVSAARPGRSEERRRTDGSRTENGERTSRARRSTPHAVARVAPRISGARSAGPDRARAGANDRWPSGDRHRRRIRQRQRDASARDDAQRHAAIDAEPLSGAALQGFRSDPAIPA